MNRLMPEPIPYFEITSSRYRSIMEPRAICIMTMGSHPGCGAMRLEKTYTLPSTNARSIARSFCNDVNLALSFGFVRSIFRSPPPTRS